MRVSELRTPALLLNRRALEGNLARMRARAAELGVSLRPHCKTAKSIDVTRRALGDAHNAITVSTLAEAAYFLEHGIADITYAIGLAPDKLDQVAALQAKGGRIGVLTDNAAAAQAIAARAADLGGSYRVHIEIDTGGGRGGIAPDDGQVLAIAEVLTAAPELELAGVLTHAGHSYGCASIDEIRQVAAAERDGVLTAKAALAGAGHACPVVSVGSTPTATFAEDLAGVTEMRPGVYMLMDLYQSQLGVCAESDIAVSVLASVIGHKPQANKLLVDAGVLAVSQDSSLSGYGRVAGHPELNVTKLYQEHGVIESERPIPFDAFPIGTHLRLLPNHACITSAMYPHYNVTDDGEAIAETWERCRGW